jgi:hypothetical protein
MTRLDQTREVLFVKFRKGEERYVFCGDKTAENVRELLRVFGKMASRSDLSFTWYDCAVLSHRVRKEMTT